MQLVPAHAGGCRSRSGGRKGAEPSRAEPPGTRGAGTRRERSPWLPSRCVTDAKSDFRRTAQPRSLLPKGRGRGSVRQNAGAGARKRRLSFAYRPRPVDLHTGHAPSPRRRPYAPSERRRLARPPPAGIFTYPAPPPSSLSSNRAARAAPHLHAPPRPSPPPDEPAALCKSPFPRCACAPPHPCRALFASRAPPPGAGPAPRRRGKMAAPGGGGEVWGGPSAAPAF